MVEHNGAEQVLAGSHVLVATGRTPNTEGLGFELAGVELTDRGYVKVNEQLQTTAYGVWAIGEVAGSPQFNENEATARGIGYRLFKVPMAAVLRAHTLSETRGFLKALVEAEGDRILGFTALGVGAGEIMSAVQIAMIGGLPYTALRDAVLTHPTLVEGLFPLFSSAASMHSATGATAVPVA